MQTKPKNGQGSNDKALRRWRVACGILLLAFFGAVGWAMCQDRNYEQYVEGKLNEYPFIDPARNFISQGDFIVNIQPLREKLRAMTAEFEQEGGDVSLYFEFLNTGANISINQEKYLYPASLIKLPIAFVVMKKIERGEWQLQNELVLMKDDVNLKSGGSPNLVGKEPVGTHFTIEKLLQELLIHSDNSAQMILTRNLRPEEFLDMMEEVGLKDLFTDEGLFSAKEYSRILRTLYTSSYLKRENSQKILEWLDQATFDEFLSYPVPKEVPFAHKYGTGDREETDSYADTGIVYIKFRPYLITVLMEGEKTPHFRERVTDFMREISKEAYDYFSSYNQ